MLVSRPKTYDNEARTEQELATSLCSAFFYLRNEGGCNYWRLVP